MGPLVRSMRPKQWVKNVFVLAALVFAHKATSWPHVVTSVAAFGAFCLLASGVYLINDVMDLEEDRKHPIKQSRPIAAGLVSVPVAVGTAVVLFVATLFVSLRLGLPFLLALLTYLALNLGYSSGLKHVVILDVMLIASGFVIRAIAGAIALDVPMSQWLLLCTTNVALFLAFTKRRQELLHLGHNAHQHRKSLSEYTVGFLDQMISVVTSCTVIAYALYTLSPEITLKFGTDALKWTIPFVIYGIFRYLYLIHVRHVPGDPTATLMSDLPSIVNVFAWGVTVLGILYFVGHPATAG
ncbi:MAG: decaprenyl-phosphate phosphoribosyltransferase [Candidatus Riflebacteria bacterium]|nr:decaprenyl-phosphate phosphoribosyltransferase [Candidatus Riflebacteria bacterium]